MAGMEVDDGPRVGGKRQSSNYGGPAYKVSQICKYWKEGRCIKGDACQWQHSLGPGVSGRVENGGKRPNFNAIQDRGVFGGSISSGGDAGDGRRRWGKPRIKRGPGRGPGNRFKQKPCSFFLRGECKHGDECHYLHLHTTVADMELMTHLAGHVKAVKGIALQQNSSSLYTGGQDRTVRVWDCTSGQCTSVVKMDGDVGTLMIESGWLFVGLPNEVKAWNMATSTQQSLAGPKGQVYALAVHGDSLFAGCNDGTILAWRFSVAASAFEPAYVLGGHTGPVVTLQAGGERLYSGSMDKTIRVWDLNVRQCLHVLQGHSNVIMGLLCWEQFLFSCSLDGYIKVWGPSSTVGFETIYTYPEDSEEGDVLDGALALCGTTDAQGKPVLLCSFNDNTVRLFDLPTFNERGVLYSTDEIRSLQTGPAGLIFSGDSCGNVKVWRWS